LESNVHVKVPLFFLSCALVQASPALSAKTAPLLIADTEMIVTIAATTL
jgi:hypothetical protein